MAHTERFLGLGYGELGKLHTANIIQSTQTNLIILNPAIVDDGVSEALAKLSWHQAKLRVSDKIPTFQLIYILYHNW